MSGHESQLAAPPEIARRSPTRAALPRRRGAPEAARSSRICVALPSLRGAHSFTQTAQQLRSAKPCAHAGSGICAERRGPGPARATRMPDQECALVETAALVRALRHFRAHAAPREHAALRKPRDPTECGANPPVECARRSPSRTVTPCSAPADRIVTHEASLSRGVNDGRSVLDRQTRISARAALTIGDAQVTQCHSLESGGDASRASRTTDASRRALASMRRPAHFVHAASRSTVPATPSRVTRKKSLEIG